MQNPNVKYLKTPQGDIAVFSLEHNRLWCRRQTADGRYTPFCIAEGVSAFSLCQYESYTYLLYPTTDGRLILSASSDLMQWEPRPLWQAGDKRWQNTYCFMGAPKRCFPSFLWRFPASKRQSHFGIRPVPERTVAAAISNRPFSASAGSTFSGT